MFWIFIAAISIALLYATFSPFQQPYTFDESVFGDAKHKEIHFRPNESEEDDKNAPNNALPNTESKGDVKPVVAKAESKGDVKPVVAKAESKGDVKPVVAKAESKGASASDSANTESKGASASDSANTESKGDVKAAPKEKAVKAPAAKGKKTKPLGLVFWMLWAGSAWAAPPSSQPSLRPKETKPPDARKIAPTSRQTTRTQAAVTKPPIQRVLIDEQGLLRHGGKSIELAELVRLSFAWKQQTPVLTVRLSIHPRAPYGVIRTVQSVLRGTGLSFTEETDVLVPSVVRDTPKASNPSAHSQPSSPRTSPPTPATKPSPSSKQDDPSQLAWDTVAIATEAERKHPANLEIRGQLVNLQGQPLASLATGLTRYVGKERLPLARQRSNAMGLFRYAIHSTTPQDRLRIAVLAPQGYLEFPVPLQDVVQGVLYIQLPVAASSTSSAQSHPQTTQPQTTQPQTTQPQVPVAVQPSRPAPPVRRPTQTPTVARTARTTQTDKARFDRIRPAETLAPSAPNDPIWQGVSLGRAEDLPPVGGIELRGRIFLADGSPAADMPTGLLLRQTERHKPIGRTRTDKQGRFRYLVAPDRTQRYDVVVLYANRLHLQSLPLPSAPTPIPDYVLRLDLKALHKLFAEGLSIVVERLSSEALRVTHFISLLYHQTDGKSQADIILPLPTNNAKVELDKQIARFKPNVLPRTIQFTAEMSSGRNRFAYSYLLPLQAGRSQIDLLVAFPSENVALFLDPALHLHPQKASKTVKLGNPGQERNFAMVQLPALSRPNLPLSFTLADPAYIPQSRLMAWLREWKQDPNKRNKLFGLSALLLLSFLGVFFLFASPAPRPTTQSK